MKTTIAFLVEQAAAQLSSAGLLSARRDSELLLLHTAGLTHTDLLTKRDLVLSPEQTASYRQLVNRRKRQEPIQYITGEREFYGLRFEVNPSVLIPRPETEHLVEAALERILKDRPIRIADIGTGSGAIAVAIAHSRPHAQVTALDISPAALEVAGRNATAHGVGDRIRFLESDLLKAIDDERFDMIVSNPPYIAETDRESLEIQVRDHEPGQALFAGPTGLEIYQRLIPQAEKSLQPKGWLLLEIGAGQRTPLRDLLKGWSNVDFVADLQAIPRVAIARSLETGPHNIRNSSSICP